MHTVNGHKDVREDSEDGLRHAAAVRWTTGPYDTGWPVWYHQRPPWTSWRAWHRFWRPRWWSSRILGTEAPEEWLGVSNTWEAQRQQTPACDWLVTWTKLWEKTGRWVFCICSDLTSPRCRWNRNGAVTHCRWTPTFGWWRGARTPWSPCPSGSGSSPAAQPGSSMMTPMETTATIDESVFDHAHTNILSLFWIRRYSDFHTVPNLQILFKYSEFGPILQKTTWDVLLWFRI